MKNLSTFITNKWWFLLGIFILLFATGINVYIPLVTKSFFDNGLNNNQFVGKILVIAGLLMINVILLTIGNATLSYVGEKSVRTFREHLISSIEKLKANAVMQSDDVKIANHLTNDSEIIGQMVSNTIPSIITSVVSWILSIAMLLILNAQMTILILLGIAVIVVVIKIIGDKMAKIASIFRKELAKLTSRVASALKFNLDIKINGADEWMFRNIQSDNKNLYQISLRGIKYRVALLPIVNGILTIILISVAGFGFFEVQSGAMTVGTLISFIMYLYQLINPTLTLSSAIGDFVTANGALSQVMDIKNKFELLNTQPKNEMGVSVGQIEKIIFKDVLLKYGSEVVVKDMSFCLEKGRTSVLVGPSGSGKSTILQSILKVVQITNGEIIIDDKMLDNISEESWYAQIGYVNQAPFILEESTIYDNLCLGKKFLKSEMDDILNELGLLAELSNKKGGEYIIQSMDSLSGGQKQRLAICRALLQAESILILDEATSALDEMNEQRVIDLLNKVKKDLIIIQATHRKQVIEQADQIINLEHK